MDELGLHKVGQSGSKIIDQFNQMSSFPVHEFECLDEEIESKRDVIRNTSVVGNAANQGSHNDENEDCLQ